MAIIKTKFDRGVEGATNIVDAGTEGTKVASGTTAQRGSTTGQFRFNSTTGKFEGRNSNGFLCLQQFCSDGFKSIRLHSSFWFIILMYVANSKPSLLPYANAKEYVCTFHQERLMHNYIDEECSVRIREIVEKSSSSCRNAYR